MSDGFFFGNKQGVLLEVIPAGSPLLGSAAAIVFRPGVPSAGNFVATWAEVKTFIAAASGDCIVYVDDGVAPAHVPGASGITEGFGRLEIRPYRSDAQNSSTLTVDDGATLRGLYRIANTIFLVSDCRSATPSFDWDYSANIVGTPFPNVFVADRAGFGSALTATQPAVVVPAGGTLVVNFTDNGGMFQPPAIPFFRVVDPTSQIIFTCYGAELRDNVGIILVPSTWVDGAGETSFDYDSPTVFNSVGLPQFSNTGAKHFHNTDTSTVALIFVTSATDVLATLQSSGRLAQRGMLQVYIEGFGGSGGGAGGQGGTGIAPGDGGGGGGGVNYCVASGLVDLSHTLDVIIGGAGGAGAPGPAGLPGGDGGDGTQSAVRDGTTAAFVCDFVGSSGGAGGGRASQPRQGGASCGVAQYVPTTAGFSAAGGSGGLPSTAGADGNTTTVNIASSGPQPGGAGGASVGGQGGGGGGGGAGPMNTGGTGGASTPTDGAPGAVGLGGAGGGGGAGGTGPANAGGAGGPGSVGYIKISFLGT